MLTINTVCSRGSLLLLAFLIAPLALAPLSAAGDGKLGADNVDQLCAAVQPDVITWRRDIHQNPELGNREFRTAGLIAEHLRSLGIDVQTEVAHTGVVGVLRGGKAGADGGPVVALRADMDALPVPERADLPFASKATGVFNGAEVPVMHACGHDTHVAILMGVAQVLSQLRDDLPGTVKFLFQPAEEGPPEGEEGGAELMVKEGALQNPDVDVVFGLHISSTFDVGSLSYRPGGMLASADNYRITVTGKQAHGSQPWKGADPIVASAHIITALQTIVSRQMNLTENASVVTVGSIHGGVRSNIIPEEVVLVGTLRALSPDDRKRIHAKVRQIASGVGESLGAEVKVEIPLTTSYPVTYNNVDLTAAVEPTLRRVAGEDNLHIVPAITGAEDFSFFAEQVPGFFFFLGGKSLDLSEDEAPGHHTPDFFIDESGLGLGVRALTHLTLDYMASNGE